MQPVDVCVKVGIEAELFSGLLETAASSLAPDEAYEVTSEVESELQM